MKNKYKYLLIFLIAFLILCPHVFAGSGFDDLCLYSNPLSRGPRLALRFIGYLLFFVKILIPLIIILIGSFDLAKGMTSSEEKDIKESVSKLIQRVIIGVIIFLLPTLLTIVLSMINSFSTVENNYNECIECLNKPNECYIPKAPDKGDKTDVNFNLGNKNKNNNEITIATWNIGRNTKGSGYTFKDFRNRIVDNSIDIIGMQEAKAASGNASSLVDGIAGYDYRIFYVNTAAGTAVLSKYNFVEQTYFDLVACGEGRKLQKTVIDINGTNVSFYNAHVSYQSECLEKQIKDIHNKIKNDPNPTILVGDFNVSTKCNLLTDYLSSLSLRAYDTVSKGIKCTDSILINDKVTFVSQNTINTNGKETDHNLIIAKLKV